MDRNISCRWSLLLRVCFDMQSMVNQGANRDSLVSSVSVAAENLIKLSKQNTDNLWSCKKKERKKEADLRNQTAFSISQHTDAPPSACDYTGSLWLHKGLFNLVPFIIIVRHTFVAGVLLPNSSETADRPDFTLLISSGNILDSFLLSVYHFWSQCVFYQD